MTATAHIRGRPAYWDEDGEVWLWADTNDPAEGWGGAPRPCPLCHKLPTPKGYDPCAGYIAGAVSVCCGHGVTDAVITCAD